VLFTVFLLVVSLVDHYAKLYIDFGLWTSNYLQQLYLLSSEMFYYKTVIILTNERYKERGGTIIKRVTGHFKLDHHNRLTSVVVYTP